MSSRWGNAASGVLTGVTAGAPFGWQAAAAGGVLGGLGGYFSSAPDQFGQQSTLSPEQQSYLSSLFGQLDGGQQGQNYNAAQSYLSALLNRDPGVYEQFAAPYMANFQNKIVPGIANRFAAAGGGMGGGALGSTAFANSLSSAGGDLQAQLAGLYSGLQNQAANQSIGNYQNFARLGLGTQAVQPYYQPGNPGIMGSVSKGLGEGYGRYLGQQSFGKLTHLFGNDQLPLPQNDQVKV